MHCYEHNDKTAVGTCKHCYKALCPDCANDTGNGLACEKHIQRVNDINDLIERNITAIKDAPVNILIEPIFTVLLGSSFVVSGLFLVKKMQPYLILLGAGFILYGIIIFIRNRKIFNRNK